MSRRVILVGGPRTGKSTYARKLRGEGVPTYCADPRSLVKDPEGGVSYLPESLDWSGASQFVADEWFRMEGDWCVEGVATVRALRKFLASGEKLDAEIVVFRDQYEDAVTMPGQRALHKGVNTIWEEIEEQARPYVKA